MPYVANPLARVTPASERLWEVDWLRGVAIVLVVYYHLMFDLQHFRLLDIAWEHRIWNIQAKAIKSMFLFLAGVGLQLSVTAARSRESAQTQLFWRYAKRGGAIFAIAMLITLATSIALPRGTIHFGILHAIGASLIITYPLLRFGYWLLPAGLALIALAFVLVDYRMDGYWLLWLGVLPHEYWTVDYAPLIPNLGVVFLGVCAARWAWSGNVRRLALRTQPGYRVNALLCLLGRHTLAIYLLHQPLLFGFFYLLDLLTIVQLYA